MRRKNYASLCGNARAVNLLIASMIDDDRNDKYIMNVRHTMCRWVMLAFELAVQKARGLMDDDMTCEFLEKEGLLKGDECLRC